VPALLLAIGIGGYHALDAWRFEHHCQAANKALVREDFEEAGQHLAHCLRLSPRSGRAHYLAAQTARRSGQIELAEEELQNCEDLGWPRSGIHFERSLLALQQGQIDPLLEQEQRLRVRENNPDRFLILEALALGYLRTYRLQLALECLNVWQMGQPHSPGALLRRGWVHDRLDHLAEAEKDYRQLLELRAGNREATERLAGTLLRQHKCAEAAELLEGLRQTGPQDAAIELAMGRAHLGLGQNAAARRVLNDLAERQPNDAGVRLELGKLALSEQRLTDACDLLTQAAALAPHAYEPHYQLLLCLRRLNAEKEAVALAGRLKEIEGDLKEMADLTDKLQRQPSDPELRFRIANIFFRHGESAEGERWLSGVIQLAPDHIGAHRLLAEHYERIGKPQRARPHRQVLAQRAQR
jgi:Flp pilus assembly protein TadD